MFVIVFRWPVTCNLRNCLRPAYAIAWGSLRGVWFWRSVYASLRGVGFAYAGMPSFCFRLWHEALEPQTTNITTNQGKIWQNEWILTLATACPQKAYAFWRPKPAYGNAYATYAVCMGAYARGTICLVEFPLYQFLHHSSDVAGTSQWDCYNSSRQVHVKMYRYNVGMIGLISCLVTIHSSIFLNI